MSPAFDCGGMGFGTPSRFGPPAAPPQAKPGLQAPDLKNVDQYSAQLAGDTASFSKKAREMLNHAASQIIASQGGPHGYDHAGLGLPPITAPSVTAIA